MKDVLKTRLQQYPDTDFKMYHYYLGILKFSVNKNRWNDNFYVIECKYNKFNPITYLYKLVVFLIALFKGVGYRYRQEIIKATCPSYFVEMPKEEVE